MYAFQQPGYKEGGVKNDLFLGTPGCHVESVYSLH